MIDYFHIDFRSGADIIFGYVIRIRAHPDPNQAPQLCRLVQVTDRPKRPDLVTFRPANIPDREI
jgi:hypothetical protein